MEELLIEKVRQHEIIYNPKSFEYRHHHIRQAAWDEIGKDLNISGKKAKDRWEKLRRCFYNARKRRLEDNRSDKPYRKKSLWKHELQMDFLTPFIESRKKHSNLDESSTEAGSGEEETTGFPKEEEESNLDLHYKPNVQTNQSAVNYDALKAFQNKKRQTIDTSSTTEILQMLKENVERNGSKCEEKDTNQSTTNIGSMDEMDMFFLSMSRMTKRLPKVEQAKIKLGLSNAVLSAEIRSQQQQLQVQHQARSSTPSPLESHMNSISLPSECTNPYYSVATESESKIIIN